MGDEDQGIRDRVTRLEVKQENTQEEVKTLRGWIMGTVALVLMAVGKALLGLLNIGGGG